MIDFIIEDIKSLDFNDGLISILLDELISNENRICGDICFIFCSDTYLLNINKKYLDHDFFTDVITFDYSSGGIISGDIFISIDRIIENAKQFQVSFDYELMRIIFHGVLHLIGYNDKTDVDKNVMTTKEDEYLNRYSNVKEI